MPSNSQKILKGISSQAIITVMLGIVEILSFSIMSRLLTKEDFGYYAAVTGVMAIFTCFSESGIGSALVQQKELTQKYINNAFTLSILFGGISFLSLLACSSFLAKGIADSSMTIPLMLMSVTLLSNSITLVNTSQMQRKLQFLEIGVINVTSLIITTIVAVFLAYKGYGYYAIIAKSVLTSFLSLLLSYAFVKPHYRLSFEKKTCKQIMQFSGWLMASGLFRNLAHDIDKILMPSLLSVVSLGAYNRPKEFVGQISTKLNGIFDSVLFPVLSGIQDNNEKIRRAFSLSLYFMNIMGMLLSLGFAINSELVIRVFFGEQWMGLKWVTVIMSFLFLFNIDGRLADCFLRSLGMTKVQFYFRIIESIVTIFSVLIGSYWGIVGVALSVVMANSFLKLLKIVYITSKIGLPFHYTLRSIIVAWRFALVLVPTCLLSYIFLPNSILGNMIELAIFFFMVIFLFLFFPGIVGRIYRDIAYAKIRDRLLIIIGKNK